MKTQLMRGIIVATVSTIFPGFSSFIWAQEATVPACSVHEPPVGCENNMWALEVKITAPNGAYVHVPDPGCLNDVTGELDKLIQTAVVAAYPKLALFSGPISKLIAQPINQHFKNHGGDLGRLFSPYAKNGAMCVPLVGIVPIEAKVKGFRLAATDDHNGKDRTIRCSPGADCPIGWSKFQSQPVKKSSSSIQTYSTIFMNWSHDRPRYPKMIIFYTLPQGEEPLQEL